MSEQVPLDLACPFCGSIDIDRSGCSLEVDNQDGLASVCMGCGAIGPGGIGEVGAAAAWNRRHAHEPGALQKLIDAAIEWAHCPDAGSYRDGPAMEDTCEELDEAVRAYLGKHIDSPPHPDHWSVEEMRERLGLTKGGEYPMHNYRGEEQDPCGAHRSGICMPGCPACTAQSEPESL